MTKEEIEQLKYIWAYMIAEGQRTNGDFSHYGGHWESDDDYYDTVARETNKNNIITQLNEHGVDWFQTGVPIFETRSEFVGTDESPDRIDTLLGTLVLKNGTKHTIGIEDAKEHYVDAIQAFLNNKKVKDIDYVNQIFKVNHDD